ncbi:MAG TPA: GNAT family N-acetyltransferase [Acidimicrobiia bacterium]|jgi:predicted acetyltransferase
MAIEIRVPKPDEAGSFRKVMSRTFGGDPRPDGDERFLRIWEPERSFCAYDDGVMVATSGAFSLNLTVPGGEMRAGGTTMVAVQPTHRRKGLLREMMTAHLRDVVEHEEPIAALWASESSIYGRFGFGTASQAVELTIPASHRTFHPAAPIPSPVRLIEMDDARQTIPALHENFRSSFPGFFRRNEGWWEERWFAEESDDRGGKSTRRFVVTAESDGYAIYRQKARWNEGHSAGEMDVVDLVAVSPEAWSGLWKYVLSHDLVTVVKAGPRPPDDPLLSLLADPRRVLQRPGDGIWTRLVDPIRALAERRYQMESSLTFEINDPFLATKHTVELTGGPDGAEARSSQREADIALDVADLSASFLGWARFRALAQAGRVRGSAETLTRADLMFGWHPQPWCPEIF